MTDYELLYETFWKEIVEEGSTLSLDQVKRELFDFHQLIVNVPKILEHVTGGACSKPLTDVNVVCSLADEYYNELHSQGNE
jgi:hypothetical protein